MARARAYRALWGRMISPCTQVSRVKLTYYEPLGGADLTRTPYGRQPVLDVLQERGLPQTALVAVTKRPIGYIYGVLKGNWAPYGEFTQAVAKFLKLPPEKLFTPEILEASRFRDSGAGPTNRVPRHPLVSRYGRQPVYWVLRERGIPQGS